MSMYLKLGTQDLTGKVYDDIKQPGGYFDVKQDGAVSLRTGARKGDPKGAYASFFVCFETEALASAFLAYVAPYSPEDPDFDEEAGADIDLYLRTDDWKYKVWGVVTKPVAVGKRLLDYLQYCYEVVCYLYSPYSDAATPQTVAPALAKIRVTPAGTLYALDEDGIVVTYSSSGWVPLPGSQPAAFVQITANNSSLLGITAAGAAYSYSAGTWSAALGGATGLTDISIASDGKIFATDASRHLRRWDDPTLVDLSGIAYNIAAIDGQRCYVRGYSDHDLWLNSNGNWSHVTSSGNLEAVQVASDGATFGFSTAGDAMKLSGTTWSSLAKTVISVAPQSASIVYYLDANGAVWKYTTSWEEICPSPMLDNSDGHIASAPDLSIVSSYNSGRAAALTVAIADSETLILATQCNSAETWELIGNQNKLLQTYIDAITAGTQWGRDWTGSGTFDTDHIELNNAQAAYIRLSGPHQINKPIKMTADLSLDSGGATGQASVQISPDTVQWTTVLDQDDFESGTAEYTLRGSEYMTNCYVRLVCTSGTSGKYMNIGSIKFEVERWIEDGAVPIVAAGATKTMTVSATGGAIAVTGTFTPRRKFI